MTKKITEKQAIQQSAADLARVILDTNRRVNQDFSNEQQLLIKNLNEVWNTILDVSKAVFTVSFTGFVALQVVDPELIVATDSALNLVLALLCFTAVLIAFSLWKKMANLGPIIEASKERLTHITEMAEWERKISIRVSGLEEIINEPKDEGRK